MQLLDSVTAGIASLSQADGICPHLEPSLLSLSRCQHHVTHALNVSLIKRLNMVCTIWHTDILFMYFMSDPVLWNGQMSFLITTSYVTVNVNFASAWHCL